MKGQLSLLEAKQKIEAFCAYQERCDQEVRKKIKSWGLDDEDTNILISDLIQNNFLSEQRFAAAFVSGKYRIKRWGKIKIEQHLKQKGISAYSIKEGMKEIDRDEYIENLTSLACSKNNLIKVSSDWDRKIKLQRYLLNKGYEHELVRTVIDDILG